ncbi:Arginine decarboxylase [hydrothermal vent metagenome]|uniref:Arginine decarboxylase n=1 Tax=hydrothermal vent metagenome TaxID=652676 RepID=A0A1W1BKV5_9ZZZZ
MNHNLFTHPTEVIVNFDEKGNYCLDKLIESQNIIDVLDDMNYDKNSLDKRLKQQIQASKLINQTKKNNLLAKLYLYLSENSYLKTIQANNKE